MAEDVFQGLADRGSTERFLNVESKAKGSSKLRVEDPVLVEEGGTEANVREDEVEGASSAVQGLLITDEDAGALPPLFISFIPSLRPKALQLLPLDDSPFCVLECPDSEVGEVTCCCCCCWDSA